MAVITPTASWARSLLVYPVVGAGAADQRSDSGVGVILENRACRASKGDAPRRSSIYGNDDRRKGRARRTDHHQRRRPYFSQRIYRGNGDERHAGRDRICFSTSGQAGGQPEPAGRSPGHHENGGGYAWAGAGPTPMRAADILSQRLPSVPKQDPNALKAPGGTTTGAPAATASPTPVKGTNPAGAAIEQKPGTNPLKPPASGTGTTLPATGSPKQAGGGNHNGNARCIRQQSWRRNEKAAEYRNRLDNSRWWNHAWRRRHGNAAQAQTYAQGHAKEVPNRHYGFNIYGRFRIDGR